MEISFHIYWWYLPAAVAFVSTWLFTLGAGGAALGSVGWIAAICIIVGRFLGVYVG